ncbi:phosphoribosylanthranilate isomerase [Eubacteriaceae bacterium ES2]|nr:phosphoribosylanthranilate isomerase [Eubacteriaceae bacterium ES2]
MNTRIKICGLTRPEDIEAVNLYLPDYIGFVFARSKRQIDHNTAINLKKMLNSQIQAVGVFVNHPINEIADIVESSVIDLIQLHGDEDANYIKSLKKRLSFKKTPIIKAVRVKNKLDIKEHEMIDYYLYDAFDKNMYGGGGQTFDWNLLKDIKTPFFLAGGINISNVDLAIRQQNPYCIDLSSGVESNGFKDAEKIKEIIQKVRRIK